MRIFAAALALAALAGQTPYESDQFRVPALVEAIDIVRPTAPLQVMTLSADPAGIPRIFRNGLLLAAPDDYGVSGRVVTFVPGCEPRPGDIVQARYFARQ
jgi:hypothetical protein